jgi:hypothetical protein
MTNLYFNPRDINWVKSNFTGTISGIDMFRTVVVKLDDGRHGCGDLDQLSGYTTASLVKKHCVIGARVHGRISFSHGEHQNIGHILRLWPEEHRVITLLKMWFPNLELRTKDPVLRATLPLLTE